MRKVLHWNNHCTFWCKNDFSAIFLSKVIKYWILSCTIPFKTILQIWAVKVRDLCVLLWADHKAKCSITPVFPSTFSLKKCLSQFYMLWWIFRKNMSKMTNVHLGLYFLPITQKQFYHKVPHLVIAGTHLVTQFISLFS